MSIAAFVKSMVPKALGPSPKLALFIFILGALVLCTIRPQFEGYTSTSTETVYDPTTYDDPSDDSTTTEKFDTTSNDDQTPPPPYDDSDMYILKSQIVPPVCPACPPPCPKNKKSADECPACPPCARCPDPSYDCKLVPNYESTNSNPIPVLNDFSAF